MEMRNTQTDTHIGRHTKTDRQTDRHTYRQIMFGGATAFQTVTIKINL